MVVLLRDILERISKILLFSKCHYRDSTMNVLCGILHILYAAWICHKICYILAQAAKPNYHNLCSLNYGNYLSHFWRPGNLISRCHFGSWWESFFWFADSYPLAVFSHGGRKWERGLEERKDHMSSIKGTNPIKGVPPHDHHLSLNISQWPYLPRLQRVNLEGDTAIAYHRESFTEGGKITSWLMVTVQIKQSKFPKGF